MKGAVPSSRPQSGFGKMASGFGKGTIFETVASLWPYLWPSDRADLRLRIIWATVLLFVAKLVTIAVPYTFKWATDALAPDVLAGSITFWLSRRFCRSASRSPICLARKVREFGQVMLACG